MDSGGENRRHRHAQAQRVDSTIGLYEPHLIKLTSFRLLSSFFVAINRRGCTCIYQIVVSYIIIIHFSDVTLLFEQWIIFKILQFILLFLNTVLGLKTYNAYCGTFGYRTTVGLFQVYFDFQNFHLTTRLRWAHYYTL